MRDIRPLTLNAINDFFLKYQLELEPHLGIGDFLDIVGRGTNITIMNSKRIYLGKLLRMGGTTPEILGLAKTIMGLGEGRSQKWEGRILAQRLDLLDREMFLARRQW